MKHYIMWVPNDKKDSRSYLFKIDYFSKCDNNSNCKDYTTCRGRMYFKNIYPKPSVYYYRWICRIQHSGKFIKPTKLDMFNCIIN